MSIESAKAFIERMKNDEEFAKKIMAATNKESRMTMVCDEGFSFTEAEIEQCMKVMTEEELDGVVGGLNFTPHPTYWIAFGNSNGNPGILDD